MIEETEAGALAKPEEVLTQSHPQPLMQSDVLAMLDGVVRGDLPEKIDKKKFDEDGKLKETKPVVVEESAKERNLPIHAVRNPVNSGGRNHPDVVTRAFVKGLKGRPAVDRAFGIKIADEHLEAAVIALRSEIKADGRQIRRSAMRQDKREKFLAALERRLIHLKAKQAAVPKKKFLRVAGGSGDSSRAMKKPRRMTKAQTAIEAARQRMRPRPGA